MDSVNGKVAIVTGGGSGIGLAIAKALAEQGAKVVISSRDLTKLEQTVSKLKNDYGLSVHCYAADIRIKQQVQALKDFVIAQFGRVDILVNNSGLGVGETIEHCSEEDWDLVVDTCTKGTFLMSQSVLPNMKSNQGGFILNIASQAAKNGYANAGPYCAAKFAVLGLAAALQEEVREHGIRVHSLCPGLVQVPAPECESDIKPGWLQVSDLAESALFVLKQPARVHLENIGLYGF
ncbi:SDR family NAD(P)-dependent oxidoreductase [Agarivorans sp. B2Z047]|uniref:SDR family oxidoreductase n=1 Tax=Agarivorans sp. B2Z047 TaxID=2652721 RepID=UPI00128B6968|nr:SDR family oxidoreductase [Agarivorans sp. B2Z047]MPW31065.1 SDR family NAD(P)-dependent oxidoreductase [Agarivorans sp. B2Z047]UQN40705.1 SDR family oxidoreductase [Agarivorans sp. B2Z047]